MHDTALIEIKALLTLALLKSGTSAKDIQTAIGVAAATRLMAGEEYAEVAHEERNGADGHITNVRDLRQGDAAATVRDRQRDQPVSALNGDVKALLSLLLLQHGATSREILTTLRMAASTRRQNSEPAVTQTTGQAAAQTDLDQPAETAAFPIPPMPPAALTPDILPADIRPGTAKQRMRSEYLAPAEQSPRAA